MNFRLWLEQEDRSSIVRRKNYFDQIMQRLQATEDDLSRPLTTLPSVKSPDPENGQTQPPAHGKGALSKVQSLVGGILHQMSNDRSDVDTSVRARRTMDVLRTRSTDGKIAPEMYLQDFLRELFGNDFHQELLSGDSGPKDSKAMPVPKPPQKPLDQPLPPPTPAAGGQAPPMPGPMGPAGF